MKEIARTRGRRALTSSNGRSGRQRLLTAATTKCMMPAFYPCFENLRPTKRSTDTEETGGITGRGARLMIEYVERPPHMVEWFSDFHNLSQHQELICFRF
jgi:hypothetical protein